MQRRAIYVVCALFALLLSGCGGSSNTSQNLGPMIRTGSAEFEKFAKQIVVDNVEADEAKRPIGDIVMTLRATMRNFTGRTINGLEIHAAVVDLEGKPVKERTVSIIPERRAELENNQTLPVQVLLEGIGKDAVRADIKIEVTGFRFK
jgi:hypothetical protein